jgi:hypothetical protein
MKMEIQRRARKGVVAGLVICSLVACGRSPKPDATIRRAYDWYVETVKSAQDPWQRAQVDLKPMVTERFLTSIENARPDIDASAMMDGRNFDAHLTIENVDVNGGAATARVTDIKRLSSERGPHVEN